MADQQVVHRRATGLQTNPNRSLAPEGALLRARNTTIDRQGVIAQRRGFRYFADLNNVGSAMFEYLKKPLILDGTTLRYAAEAPDKGTLTDWPGTYTPPSSQRMRGVEIDRKFLFTTSLGPYIQESAAGTPRRAGIPPGLDIQLSLTGTGIDGFQEPDTQVSYRVCFGKESLPPGSPSFQEVIANLAHDVTLTKSGTTVTVAHTGHGYLNGDTVQILDPVDATYIAGPHVITYIGADSYSYTVTVEPTGASTTAHAGKTQKVNLEIRKPAEVQAGWWVEIYRTLQSVDALTWPGDEHYLVIRYTIPDPAPDTISYLDTRDDTFLVGVTTAQTCYTNPGTREGIAGANDRPPYCEHISSWRGHVWYMGNVHWEHFRDIQLLDVTAMILGDTITITSGGASVTYTAAASESHPTGRNFKMWTTESIPTVNVRLTAKSLVHVINGDSESPVYAYYTWDPIGNVRLVRKDLLDIPFYLTGSNGTLWSPTLPTSGDTVVSDCESKPHIVARSKFQKPESCPRTNTNEIGKLGQEILGPQPLKESQLIYTYSGIYEITGETDGLAGRSFSVREVDPTLRLLNPDCLCSLDTVSFAWCDGGLCRVSSAGSLIVSTAIDSDLQRISRFNQFSKAFFVAYESYHKLLVWLPSILSSSMADAAYVYDYLLNLWCGVWEKAATGGLVIDDLLYILRADTPKVSVERKSYLGGEDFLDEEDEATITSSGTTTLDGRTVSTRTITWTGTDPRKGWCWKEGLVRSLVYSATDNGDGTWTLVLEDHIA